jgi:hypothetical protein
VLELKGNIRVFCRVRPQLKHESGAGCDNAIFFKVDSLKKKKSKKSPQKIWVVICVGIVPLYIMCAWKLTFENLCDNTTFEKQKHERPDLEENCISVLDESKGSEKTFEFDHCFGPESTQEQVLEED